MFKMCKLLFFSVCIYFLVVPGSFITCVPIEYDVGSESYDLDTEQSEARYDPRLLSEELRGSHTETQGAEACISSESRYEHGQKISRTDPCEVCLCVDGEVFCWWKQCESSIKKPLGKLKLHSKNIMKISTNFTKSVENFPKGILSFPLNLPVHLPISNEPPFKSNQLEIESTVLSIKSSTTSSPTISNEKNKKNNNNKILEKDEKQPVSNLQENILSSNISVNSTNCCDLSNTQISLAINNKNNTKNVNQNNKNINLEKAKVNLTPNKKTDDKLAYYEKTIINKNGLFVENIRKISDIDDNTVTSENSNEKLMDEDLDQQEEPHQIKIDDITAGQHYVITASGNVENTDVLASENVLSQFKNNFLDFSTDDSKNLSKIIKMNNTFLENKQDIRISSTEFSPTTSTRISTNITTTTTTMTTEQNCIVMGISYKIGTVLPQETGNCLQCICIEGATTTDSPRVTCNPHNCPPLVLPDLFDTTGY